jgi:succinate-acetate transporter protein
MQSKRTSSSTAAAQAGSRSRWQASRHGHEQRRQAYARRAGADLPAPYRERPPARLFSFGIGMLLLGTQALTWIPLTEQKDVGMPLIVFVFPLELIATIMAFLARDTLGATTLGLFTTSWLTLGWVLFDSPPGRKSVTLGIYLFGFATAALLLALMSTLGKPFFSVLLTAAVAWDGALRLLPGRRLGGVEPSRGRVRATTRSHRPHRPDCSSARRPRLRYGRSRPSRRRCVWRPHLPPKYPRPCGP